MSERKPSGKQWVAAFSTIFLAGCAVEKITPQDITKTKEPEAISSPVPTGTETSTQTSTPAATLTPTPTPDWGEVNHRKIETSLEGEEVIFENVRVNEVVKFNLPILPEMLFGMIRDSSGSVQAIIENFDCEYNRLRDNGLLEEGEVDLPIVFPGNVWVVNQNFQQIKAVKSANLGGIDVFTSESFIFDGMEMACEEYSVIERLDDNTRELIEALIERVEDIRN